MAMARAKGSDTGGRSEASGTPAMGYEEARNALAEVVTALESGEATLEDALALWEQGEQYARVCEAWLAGAQQRLSREEQPPEESAPPSD